MFIFCTAIFAKADIEISGVPNIINHSKNEYRGGTQNWAITQDQKGFIYIANNAGILIFDGVNWQLKQMPNFSSVRSVFINSDDQIYIGAYNEFGKLDIGKNGEIKFKSFKQHIPAEFQSFDDIWNISSFKNKVLFQSYNYAFFVENDSIIEIIKAPSKFQNTFKVNSRLYFNDNSKGLLEYNSGEIKSIPGFESLIGVELASILPFDDNNSLIICSINKGIFIFDGNELKPWNISSDYDFQKIQIYSAAIIQNYGLAIGTIQDGLYILDKKGNSIYHLNRNNGLQNNTVLEIFVDRSSNIWLGLDNGIDYININSQISFIKQTEPIGAGYTAIKHNGKMYLGTNQGLYVKNPEFNNIKEDFRLIKGTGGQVWSLGIFNNILICGHNNGTYIVENERVKKISEVPGAWKFIQPKRFRDYLIGGNYEGFTLFKFEDNEWKFVNKISGFNESSRVFEEDENGDVWMSHGYKGIFRVKFESNFRSISNVRHYTVADGLPSNYYLNLYKIKGKNIVTSRTGIYEYNSTSDKFENSSFFDQILYPTKNFSYLNEDSTGNIWYNAEENGKNFAGVYQLLNDQTYKNIVAPFALLTNKFINGFESVIPLYDNNVLFCTQDGFAFYSSSKKYNVSTELSAYINRASALYLDSTFFFGNFKNNNLEEEIQKYRFPYKNNSFKFSFTSPQYENQINIEYCYKLSSYNEKWSDWSNTPFCEFAKLPPGKYVFNVKAKNQTGLESEIDSLVFEILPPWYLTVYLKTIYGLLIIVFIAAIVFYFFRRIEMSKRKERLKQLKKFRQKERDFKSQAILAEKKIIELKNDKLKTEMIHRDKELANQTMNIIKKNKFLAKIKEELEKIKSASTDQNQKNKITALINKIDKDIDQENQWEVFETAFDEVHEDFLNRLKTLYPNLTPKELKLCAYLRMNISTKEIAPLMNISIRGVEICRYRVRKKLNIDRDQNLTSMIIDL